VIAVAGGRADAATWRARGASAIASVSTVLIRQAFASAARETAVRAHAGLREPLVLLPGMLGTGDLWVEVAAALAEHTSIRIGRIDLADTVAELAETVLVTAPPTFALAGHSLGGIVALEVLRRAPERVTRVALLNSTARPPAEPQLQTWAAYEKRIEAGEFAALAREFAVANLPTERRGDAELVDRVEAMALAIGAAAFRDQLAAQRSRPDLRPLLPEIAVPALVLSGAEDEISPRAAQDELAAGIPGSEHVTVESAGHLAPLESPDAVAEHLLAWLDR
jgi:pimeloyl-ACP methyl ester carboxylesterase